MNQEINKCRLTNKEINKFSERINNSEEKFKIYNLTSKV